MKGACLPPFVANSEFIEVVKHQAWQQKQILLQLTQQPKGLEAITVCSASRAEMIEDTTCA